MRYYDCLIIGTGHAGAQAALALRQQKFEGSIGLLGEETELPYERPPLSKDYLAGDKSFDRILIRPRELWSERDIDLLPGRRVVGIDSARRQAHCEDGSALAYGNLIWAAGGKARTLSCPGHDLAGIHSVRSRGDVDAIIDGLGSARSVVLVGGGYIGLETAAVLAKLGKKVTVLEAADRVLARVAGEALSRFYEQEHRANGVDIRLNASIEHIEGIAGRVAAVRLKDGEAIPADMLIVGIGIVPSVDPLCNAGAQGGDGVDVDAYCRTSLPNAFAIGDCARHSNPYAGGDRIRLESVQNATDQAMIAAKALCGRPEAYDAVPWFWSNQYDLRLQTIGLSRGHDQVIVRGDPGQRSFSLLYLCEGRVQAIDSVNAPRDFVQGRFLVAGRAQSQPELLANSAIPLKSLMTLADENNNSCDRRQKTCLN
jgi:3-phenylpropionate/trans-cinnamate dioxygenase ferredoxin reductase subunit